MTSFANSTKLLKGSIVLTVPETHAAKRIIFLQYNSDSILCILQVQGVGGKMGTRSELTRLLSNGGLATNTNLVEGVALVSLSTSGIQLTGNTPTQLGQQIAQPVYGVIGHE